ncbi:MAG TPA: hypothetical protein VMP01_07845 [Pirellulaceae bacterium]|nr:hypothetical protein [Pirellulaceae bacterium]
MPQISLRTLLLLVALLSAALGAIISASELANYVLLVAIAVCPPIAVLLAIYSDGARRAFWTGFSVLGLWSYFFVFTDVGVGYPILWRPLREVFDEHATDAILALHRNNVDDLAKDSISSRTYDGRPLTQREIDRAMARDLPRMTRQFADVTVDRSFENARYSIGLAIAIVGGFFACLLHRLRERRQKRSVI